MKDFGKWFAEQGTEQPVYSTAQKPLAADHVSLGDDVLHMRCWGCGKEETVERKAYENGDTGWYSEDFKTGTGLCGGGPRCTP